MTAPARESRHEAAGLDGAVTGDGRRRRSPARRSAMAGAGSDGALDHYLRDISAYPLIDRDEEVRLARLIAAGDREALDTLVRCNLRFVVSVAKRYSSFGVPLADLVSEGNMGLIRAAHRFDPDQGVRFISYASWWVRQSIRQALAEQSRLVRIPLNRAGELNRIVRTARTMAQELGREATAAEVAACIELPLQDVEHLLSISRAHVSIDAPVTADTAVSLAELLADDGGAAPDDSTLEQARVGAVEESLARLNEREARVLRLYYGFDGDPLTLEEIGTRLGITRERVRQIREKALLRLRISRAGRTLSDFC